MIRMRTIHAVTMTATAATSSAICHRQRVAGAARRSP